MITKSSSLHCQTRILSRDIDWCPALRAQFAIGLSFDMPYTVLFRVGSETSGQMWRWHCSKTYHSVRRWSEPGASLASAISLYHCPTIHGVACLLGLKQITLNQSMIGVPECETEYSPRSQVLVQLSISNSRGCNFLTYWRCNDKLNLLIFCLNVQWMA